MTEDREPGVFPRVGGTETGPGTTGDARQQPLFTPADDRVHGNAPQIVVTQPVDRPPQRQSWLRWAAAGVGTLLVVAVVAGVLLLAGPRAGTPSVVEYYVPADTAAYVDVRLDLPGDQRDRLATFMSHFPGFADPASFQQKIDESLTQMLRSANTGLEWERDVAPWFGGEVALFGQTLSPTEGTPPSLVIAVTVNDRAALEALLDARLVDHVVDTVDHQGHQIRSFIPDPGSERLSFAVTDELVLVGRRFEDIQAALDVKAGTKPSLAQDQFFLQQLGALHADRLATAYYDMGRVIDAVGGLSPGTVIGVDCLDSYQEAARVKYVAEVRAEGDHMAITTRAQAPTGANLPPLPQNKTSVLAAAMPADTIAYAEFRQVGASVKSFVGQFLDCMTDSGQIPLGEGGIEQLLGVAPEDYLDFVDDVALSISIRDDLPSGGLVATVDDEAVARQRVERLLASVRALVALGGGVGVSIEDIEHNGATITVFTIDDLPPGMPATSFAVSVANGRLYIGVNGFVTEAMDRQAGDSFATSERYRAALVAGGPQNAGVVFLDVARVREMVEASILEPDRQRYETEMKPFLAPITTLSVINRVDNGIMVGHVFLHVE